jgi:hypothetical protein
VSEGRGGTVVGVVMKRRPAALVAVLVAAATVVGGLASADPLPSGVRAAAVTQVSGSASATSGARRVVGLADAVSISVYGGMTPEAIDGIEAAARAAGVPSVRGRSLNIGLRAVRRGNQFVQVADGPGGGSWQFPMSVTVLAPEAIGPVFGLRIAAAVAGGGAVLDANSAALRGAQVGDVLDLVALDGGLRTVTLAAIATSGEIGSAELVIGPDIADWLGASIVTRILLFGQMDRGLVDAELTARGFVDGNRVRIVRSWAPANPDGLLSSSQVKQRLGEFAYRVNANGGLTLDQAWRDANLLYRSYGSINVRTTCHQAITGDLQAALDEVAAAGLGGLIDLGNTNTYGGCYNPRFATQSGSFGSVSRHAWAMAIDMNTTTNPQGGTPRMDCRIVRIFRKHNFAWGGNFLVPDGMHFEWVGQPRHTWAFPSRYCPNLPDGATQALGEQPDGRTLLFAEDLLPGD